MKPRCSDDNSSRWNCVIKIGQRRRIYFDAEWRGASPGAGRNSRATRTLRVVITGGAPGYFNRHFDTHPLLRSRVPPGVGRRVARERDLQRGIFSQAMALCESMPKPVIARHLRQRPWPCVRVRGWLAIFVSLRTATTSWDYRR